MYIYIETVKQKESEGEYLRAAHTIPQPPVTIIPKDIHTKKITLQMCVTRVLQTPGDFAIL